MCLALPLALLVLAAQDTNTFEFWLTQSEKAKASRDFAAMEKCLGNAHRFGQGTEYSWRGVAWAQMNQGKWRESLESAIANHSRFGPTGWTCKQLYESAKSAGDASLARNALRQWKGLTGAQLDVLWSRDLEDYLSWVATKSFRITYVLDSPSWTNGQEIEAVIPIRKDPLQTFNAAVEGDAKLIRRDGRDFVRWTVQAGKAPKIAGILTLHPRMLPQASLQAARQTECPPGMSGLLKVILIHGSIWDPQDEALSGVAAAVKGRSHRDTIENILLWLARSFRYEDKGSVSTLAGTMRLKKGVCWHYCNLFVALCRRNGIPAKILHCTALGNQPIGSVRMIESGHGQAVAYLGGLGWLRIEPQDPNSLRNYTNNVILFGFSPEDNKDDWGRYTSLQGVKAQVERLSDSIPAHLVP